MKVPGRWDKMTALLDELMEIEQRFYELESQAEDLQAAVIEAEEEANESKKEYLTAKKEADEAWESLFALAKEKRKTARTKRQNLQAWKDTYSSEMQEMRETIRTKQRVLKSLCSSVRNEYSTTCLQEDFRLGLKELCRGAEEESNNPVAGAAQLPLPDDFEIDVFANSANDYLKISGVKNQTDGPPNCFMQRDDTQIPSLRSFVHQVSLKAKKTFAESFLNEVSDVVDRIKLLASDGKDSIASGTLGRKCKSIFDAEIAKLRGPILREAKRFQDTAFDTISTNLQPALQTGASRGREAAMATVRSWGSKSRRTRNERTPENNGLYYSTYNATVKRYGIYTSASAGAINLNQELCDPMEKEFGNHWQQTMDESFRKFLGTRNLQRC